MDGSQDRQSAFSHWLRTGRWPSRRGIELKFNPYHDPRNGQFTFAPGGPQSLSQIIVSHGRRDGVPVPDRAGPVGKAVGHSRAVRYNEQRAAALLDAVYRPDQNGARLNAASFPRPPRMSRGGNIRAFHEPMTPQQVFPGLRGKPGGAIVALADDIFGIAGASRELTAELTRDLTDLLINQIRAVDPDFRFDSLGFPQTIEGQVNQINDLRFRRAAAFLKIKGEVRPLQVETLRFVQESTDLAYAHGVELLRKGRLPVRLSEQEALGNFIDRQVRRDLRDRYKQYGVDSTGTGPVRVNRRENDSSGSDITFRRPDARVGNVAFDVTLTQKTLRTPQVCGFFNADFKPSHVVIIRPQQISPGSSYIISRPEIK